ncbi:hypothetical protein ACFL23_02440 [Patescibacteria group bacterium]
MNISGMKLKQCLMAYIGLIVGLQEFYWIMMPLLIIIMPILIIQNGHRKQEKIS